MPRTSIPALVALLVLTATAASCQIKGDAPAAPTLDSALTASLTQEIARLVREGFLPGDGIAALVAEYAAEGVELRTVMPVVAHLTDSLLAEHARVQAGWTLPTDCDRLDAAFATLEKRGIVCRQNFSCCGSCGAGEIADEMISVQEAGATARGYAFYHQQDTEGAVERQGLYLSYGATEESEAAALGVANEIVAAIRQQGLQVAWDGTWEQRIHVALDWKRRR